MEVGFQQQMAMQSFPALFSSYFWLKGVCSVTQHVVTPQQNVAIHIGQSMYFRAVHNL